MTLQIDARWVDELIDMCKHGRMDGCTYHMSMACGHEE